MRVLSLVNQKGGCGKTTVAIHLATALAQAGRRVLICDLDPQAHATLGLGQDGESRPGLAEVLNGDADVRGSVVTVPGGASLLPASVRLGEFEEAAVHGFEAERALRKALRTVAGDYDFALLDCPARADSVLTANALHASTLATLVVETGAFALQGALKALALFREIGERQGSRFDVRVLATLFDRRTRFARELLVALQARFGASMFETAIRSSVRLREAAACGQPVQVFDPGARAATDFAALATEVLRYVPSEGLDLREAASDPASEGSTTRAWVAS